MEQSSVHVGQRFEQVDKRFDDVQAEIRSLRTIMFTLYVPIVVAVAGTFVGVAVKFLFFNS
jgi:heme/copper-type cytochrome/quinol oxidase subunit 2